MEVVVCPVGGRVGFGDEPSVSRVSIHRKCQSSSEVDSSGPTTSRRNTGGTLTRDVCGRMESRGRCGG